MYGLGLQIPYYGFTTGYYGFGGTSYDIATDDSASNSLSWWSGEGGGYSYNGYDHTSDVKTLSEPWYFSQQATSVNSNWNGFSEYGPGFSLSSGHYDSAISQYGISLSPFSQMTSSHFEFNSNDFSSLQIGPIESDWSKSYHADVTAVTYATPWWSLSECQVNTSLIEQSHLSAPGFDETSVHNETDQSMHLFSTAWGGFSEMSQANHTVFDFTKIDTPYSHVESSHFDEIASSSSLSVSLFGSSTATDTSHDVVDHFANYGGGYGEVADHQSHNQSHVTEGHWLV